MTCIILPLDLNNWDATWFGCLCSSEHLWLCMLSLWSLSHFSVGYYAESFTIYILDMWVATSVMFCIRYWKFYERISRSSIYCFLVSNASGLSICLLQFFTSIYTESYYWKTHKTLCTGVTPPYLHDPHTNVTVLGIFLPLVCVSAEAMFLL